MTTDFNPINIICSSMAAGHMYAGICDKEFPKAMKRSNLTTVILFTHPQFQSFFRPLLSPENAAVAAGAASGGLAHLMAVALPRSLASRSIELQGMQLARTSIFYGCFFRVNPFLVRLTENSYAATAVAGGISGCISTVAANSLSWIGPCAVKSNLLRGSIWGCLLSLAVKISNG